MIKSEIFTFLHAFFRALTRKPLFISHLITGKCNAGCLTCRWRNKERDGSLEEILNFYKRAKDAGFYSTTIWGGEPLIREDIIEIVKGIKRMGFRLGIITNGYYLKEKLAVTDYLDFLIISIDAVGGQLDRIRNLPGLFERIIGALNSLNRIKLIFNTVVSNLSYPDCLRVVEIAKKYKAILFYEYPIGKGLINKKVAGDAFIKIKRLKEMGLPIGNSFDYLISASKGEFIYRCRAKDFSITIDNGGWLKDCITGERIGNVYQEDLKEILKKEEYHKFKRRARGCSRCTDSGAFESAQAVHLKPQAIFNVLRLFIS